MTPLVVSKYRLPLAKASPSLSTVGEADFWPRYLSSNESSAAKAASLAVPAAEAEVEAADALVEASEAFVVAMTFCAVANAT